ncbi:zinc finger protein 681 [Drosophila hydei]|uniref:Zinc finger protein 681 n=1 Tax=Drosophila hydei TaxID=7224 RepID=A0A6J1LLC2_DROHY|nr:zinc finger protein 681 [Drosophila hydei]
MIKLQPDFDRTYFNFRCGEVLCVSPTSYDVCCTLCGQQVPYEGFPQHFQQKHLTETETEDCKLFSSQAEEQHLDTPVDVDVEPLAIKSEDDPIAHDETHVSNNHVNVDLAQIALLDREHETDKVADFTASKELVSSIATRRQRREAALKNILVQQKTRTTEDETTMDKHIEWRAGDVNTSDVRLKVNENSDSDNNDDYEDDTRDMLFQCDQCDRAYNTKRSLQSHKRSKHNFRKPTKPHRMAADVTIVATTAGSVRRKPRKDPAKIYKCDETECNQTFRTERDLRGHRWKHTGIFCDICGKPFTQSGNMMRHRQRHSGIKPYKCQQPDCEATFYTQKELTSHNICHTGRMPCICEVCGRPCRDRGVLTAHMRRHTGERPAKCEVCGKAFYSFHDLNVHAVSHTNLRPFVCDVCGSTFQRKKALRVHKLLHSEQRKYSCKLCNKMFAQSGGLNAHMRTHETARARAKAKTKTTTVDVEAEVEEAVNTNQLLEEAVTIEVLQEQHSSHVEVVTVATAGSWHVP